ncbi:phytanoyl-CoA dioxygenase family protein [Thermosynechococcus sp. HN-54]|uniref:phytanoyl-CoA dioxygenase family protein n=1 Tax=Thermosynechococcus sp. HN-54 TaxID=2933959 RepID=UPI00202CE19D|nr:phytanoyl-CoA dioxygenase family protein [Thermosynechococcus sp. HN-54]URR34927.1 phytanoyl-CoA dioxygenase family protein [Thermosynechococcus sp. HN-54]
MRLFSKIYLLKLPIDFLVLGIFFIYFLNYGQTPQRGYLLMRNLYVKTNGWLTQILAKIYKIYFRYSNVNKSLPKINHNIEIKLTKILDELRRDEFSVLEKTIELSKIEKIYHFSLNTLSENDRKLLRDNHHLGKKARIFYSVDTIFESEDIQSIIFDNDLLNLAYLYLEAPPVLDLVTMWWSVPSDNSCLSEEAQLFHFDYDRFKFLKFFFYLTDFSPVNGPHCYVKGSHIHKPRELFRDERFTDDLIRKYYSEDKIVEICGAQGTIIVADTIGFHKGKPLEKGSRLLLQIQFSLSKFGQSCKGVDESKILPQFYNYYQGNLIHYEPFFKTRSKYLR